MELIEKIKKICKENHHFCSECPFGEYTGYDEDDCGNYDCIFQDEIIKSNKEIVGKLQDINSIKLVTSNNDSNIEISAEEMFARLGYTPVKDGTKIYGYRCIVNETLERTIYFHDENTINGIDCEFYIYDPHEFERYMRIYEVDLKSMIEPKWGQWVNNSHQFTAKEIEAINQQCKENGWLND